MYKTNLKLLIFVVEVISEHLTTIKGKTWSRGTNSLLPFCVNVNLDLYIFNHLTAGNKRSPQS